MTGATVDWQAVRARFPVLERRTYLNSCAYGAMSVGVMESLQHYVNDRLEKGCDWNYWVERNDAVRDSMARLLNAASDEVAVTTSASAGINAIASSLNFDGPRKKVVISDYEFPTNAQIWYAQERRGARVVRVAEQDGYIPVECFEAAIDEETAIVAITQVCFRNGAKLDIPAIAEISRRKGALILMDGYQCLGTTDFDPRQSGVDFAVGGMVKYLLGTAGVAFLYVRRELIESLVPTVTGWFAAEDIFAMETTRYNPASTARRFEMGTPPVVNTYAAEAGLAELHAVGLGAIGGRVAELTAAIKMAAAEAGYSVTTPQDPSRHGPMIAIRAREDAALVALLEDEGIVTSNRDGNLRVAMHFYNNEQDIDTLFRALKRHRHLMS